MALINSSQVKVANLKPHKYASAMRAPSCPWPRSAASSKRPSASGMTTAGPSQHGSPSKDPSVDGKRKSMVGQAAAQGQQQAQAQAPPQIGMAGYTKKKKGEAAAAAAAGQVQEAQQADGKDRGGGYASDGEDDDEAKVRTQGQGQGHAPIYGIFVVTREPTECL